MSASRTALFMHWCRIHPKWRAIPLGVALMLAAVSLPNLVAAQEDCGGATVSPDGRILVNKEQGTSRNRWTIIATTLEAPGDGLSIISVSGNVSRRDGTPEQFLYCLPDTSAGNPDNAIIRDDGQGSINLVCRAVDPSICERSGLTAQQCLKEWPGESLPLVTLPKTFFLPRIIPCGPPDSPSQITPDARVVVTYDEREYLVNKAVQNERWTISLAKPATAGDFSEAPALGNVFFPSGQDPLFLYCRPKGALNIYKDASQIDFRCQGSSACSDTLAACRAESRWDVVAESVPLAVSFFLPPGGSGQASAGCEYGNDPATLELYRNANCRVTDQKCVACRAAAQGSAARVSQEPCGDRVGNACTLPIDGCDDEIIGVLADSSAGECFCVGEIPDSCLSCESLRLKAGDRCELVSTAQRTIVGTCQPRTAGDAETFCLPPDFADTFACGGPATIPCASGTCCRSDAGDACGPAEISCDGVCVSGQGGACDDFTEERGCGDGTQQADEACDDGNKVAGDGCSPECTVELCAPGSSRTCLTGLLGVCALGNQVCDSTGNAYGECRAEAQANPEDCENDIDDDCDGATDADDLDCQRCEPTTEVCNNGQDDDCDGQIDFADPDCVCEPLSTDTCPTGQAGACALGLRQCNAQGTGFGECVQSVQPEPEDCGNGIDDDCDGTGDATDVDCRVCDPLSTEPCDSGLSGACADGTKTCNGAGSAFGECVPDVSPGEIVENCSNEIDDDCDGQADATDADCIPSSACDNPRFCSTPGDLNCSDSESCTPPGGIPVDQNFCGGTTEGEAYCVPEFFCEPQVACVSSSDCAPNERCIVETGCDCNGNGPARCMAIDICPTGVALGAAREIRREASSSSMVEGRTSWVSGQ